jgi:integrase
VGQTVGRRVLHKLTTLAVQRATKPGYYGDGGGLYLQVGPTGSKSWVFRFTRAGKSREMGLGPQHTISLADARAKALLARKAVLDGLDPIEARREQGRAAVLAAAKAVTFKDEADAYIKAHRAKWSNAKHEKQWSATLETYALPHIGKLLVSEIDTPAVLRCLAPIWNEKTETASRVRGRIEAVLDYATAAKHRTGDNPARWSGNLEHLLAERSAVAKVEHHAALPYARIAEFVKALRAVPAISARAVELVILTVARTSEAFNAKWPEFDLDEELWTVPKERMKSGREHRVPLSREAVHLLKLLQEHRRDDYVFPGASEGKPLSNMAGLKLLDRMGYGDYTVHGFRSTFRDWAAEQTNFPRELQEAALAHVLKDKTEAAYQRGDLLMKRAKLMQAWADFCGRDAATVTPIAMRRKNAA